MKLNKQSGYIVYSPLSYAFSMVELGGSTVQKFNSVENTFSPNRRLTPYKLQPKLMVTDPDHIIVDGDYTTKLVSVKWKVDHYVNNVLHPAKPGVPGSSADHKQIINYGDYFVEVESHALTYVDNVSPGEIVKITFSADYIDSRRKDKQVQHFEWNTTLSCVVENPVNLKAKLSTPSKLSLSPFKMYANLAVKVLVYNGSKAVTRADAFQWQYLVNSGWRNVTNDLPWVKGGLNTDTLILDQDYIGRVRLRCRVDMPGYEPVYSDVTLLRRWYGQYEENFEFLSGRYITRNTRKADVQLSVTNRQGTIVNPCRFFDLAIFYPNAYGEMRCVSNTDKATVDKNEFFDGEHCFGYAVRELSEFVPITDSEGNEMTDTDGNVMYVQLPTVNIEL